VIRTQVSLDPVEYKLAKKEARALGISFAELVRRAVRENLQASRNVPRDAPWMRYVGMVDSGDPNSSQKIDEIVYGRDD
jgi:hypothetical protein